MLSHASLFYHVKILFTVSVKNGEVERDKTPEKQ